MSSFSKAILRICPILTSILPLETLYTSFVGQGDGYSYPTSSVTICDVVMGIAIVVYGSTRQRLRFLFRIWDVKKCGHLDHNQMKELLRQICENSPNLPDELEIVTESTVTGQSHTTNDRSLESVHVILPPALSSEQSLISSASHILEHSAEAEADVTPSDLANDSNHAVEVDESAKSVTLCTNMEQWDALRSLFGGEIPQCITYEHFELIVSYEPKVIEYFEVVAFNWQKSHARVFNRKKKASLPPPPQTPDVVSHEAGDGGDPKSFGESAFPKYFSSRNLTNLSKKLFSLESLTYTPHPTPTHPNNTPLPSPSPSPSASPSLSTLHPGTSSYNPISPEHSHSADNVATPPQSPLLFLSPITSDPMDGIRTPSKKPLSLHTEIDSDDFRLDGNNPSNIDSDPILFRTLSPPRPPPLSAPRSSSTSLWR